MDKYLAFLLSQKYPENRPSTCFHLIRNTLIASFCSFVSKPLNQTQGILKRLHMAEIDG